MKNYNHVEIILFSKYSLADLRHKELVTWLGTTAQSAIFCQHEKAKKLFLRTLKNTPAIYMSWNLKAQRELSYEIQNLLSGRQSFRINRQYGLISMQ